MRKLIRAALAATAVAALSCGTAFALAPEHDMDINVGLTHNLRSGQGACSYCHVPHGASGGASNVRLAKAVTTVDASFGGIAAAFCANCHLGQATYTAIGAPNGTNTMLSVALGRRNHPVGDLTVVNTVDTARVGPYSTSAGMECTSCHDPHSNEEVATGYAQFLRAATYRAAATPTSFCALCHLDRTDGTAAGDHPVNIVGSAAVQAGLTTNAAAFVAAEGIITGGHLVDAAYTTTNDGVSTDVTTGLVSCQTCHMPHAAAQGNDTFPLFSIAGDGCAACHTDTPNGNAAQNHPVGTDPGMAGNANNNTTGLFVRLHDYTAAVGSQHSTSATTRWPNTTNLPLYTISGTPATIVVTAAAAGGMVLCKTCHGGAHTTPSDTAFAGIPLLREAANVMCVNCHGQNNAFYMADGVASGNHATAGGNDTATGWYRNPTGLTFASTWIGGAAKAAQMNGNNVVCNTCHVAHGAAGIGSLNNLTNGATDTKNAGDRVLLIADNDTAGQESGLCITCHAPAGTHPTTVVDNHAGTPDANLRTTVGDSASGAQRAMNLGNYPIASKTTSAMRYDSTTGMYCQSCHVAHQGQANFGTFILRESGSDAYETADGTGPATGATEPTNWSRDPACGTRTNTTGCHNL